MMHRFPSQSADSDLYGTLLRRPTERNTVRTDDCGDAVDHLCILRARG